MRRAYFTLQGGLYGYWGYAPVRPLSSAASAARFSTPPGGLAERRAGGLAELAAPSLTPKRSLTPLANTTRRPCGGFDNRFAALKGARKIRAARRSAMAPGSSGHNRGPVRPFISFRGGWGAKGRRASDFLRADPWASLTKQVVRTPATGALWWAPVSRGPKPPRGSNAPRLALALSFQGPNSGAGGGLLGLRSRDCARASVWTAGLGAPLTPRVIPVRPLKGLALLGWL